MNDHIKKTLSSLPLRPGVYRFWNDQRQILYVGKARELKKRVGSYFSRSHDNPRIQSLVEQIADIEITITSSEEEALLLEVNLIKSLKPPFNILFRDDKTYPYLTFSKHVFPRLAVQRGRSMSKSKDLTVFGPYPDSSSVYRASDTLQRIFKLRVCEDHVFNNRDRPCLLYQTAYCSGPCVNMISQEDYAQDVDKAIMFLSGKNRDVIEHLESDMQKASDDLLFERAALLRDQIVALQKMLSVQSIFDSSYPDLDMIGGLFAQDSSFLVIHLISVRSGQVMGHRSHFFDSYDECDDDMQSLITRFLVRYYQNAQPPPVIFVSDAIDARQLQYVLKNLGYKGIAVKNPASQHAGLVTLMQQNLQSSAERREADDHRHQLRWQKVCELMNLGNHQLRAECFDISHHQGDETIGSCVVFDHYALQKKQYRRYIIRDIVGGDDIAAMYQAVFRHYKQKQTAQQQMPDLIIIDGAQPQLNAAERALADLDLYIAMVSLSKGVERRTGEETLFFSDQRPELKLSIKDPALLLLAEIRDEAHRWAITGHRDRRIKKVFKSPLEEIEGLGPKRRRLLLTRFGSVRAMMDLNPETLATVPGISYALAVRIHNKLRG